MTLNQFLTSVQKRAFITAKLATENEDDALDIVQDSMFKLAKSYPDKSEQEWPALFQRVLQNAIKDWYRKQKVRKIMWWWQQDKISEEELPIDYSNIPREEPEKSQQTIQTANAINAALRKLPFRQQQAFILRAWWEHSTEETAAIMGCSAGSVKTHYSRASKALANALQEVVL